jgi:hypothetical protein
LLSFYAFLLAPPEDYEILLLLIDALESDGRFENNSPETSESRAFFSAIDFL